jgi:hypothetical protein
MPDPEAQRQQLQQAHSYMQRASLVTASQYNTTSTPPSGPNFSKIYTFLASLFDNQATNHIEKLAEMSTIDRETVQLLMHNLAINLANPTFRDQHSSLMDQYRTILQSRALLLFIIYQFYYYYPSLRGNSLSSSSPPPPSPCTSSSSSSLSKLYS